MTLYVPRPSNAHDNVDGYHRAYITWEYPGSGKDFGASSQLVSGIR